MRRSRTLSDNAKKLGIKSKNITNNNLERQSSENKFSNSYYNQDQQNPLKLNNFIKNKEDTLIKQDIFNRSINDSLDDDHKFNKPESSRDKNGLDDDRKFNNLESSKPFLSLEDDYKFNKPESSRQFLSLDDSSREELRDGSQDELRDLARDELYETERNENDKSNLQLEEKIEDIFPSKVNNEKFITKNQFISKQQFQSNEQPIKNNESQIRNRLGRSPKEEETVPKQTIINLIKKCELTSAGADLIETIKKLIITFTENVLLSVANSQKLIMVDNLRKYINKFIENEDTDLDENIIISDNQYEKLIRPICLAGNLTIKKDTFYLLHVFVETIICKIIKASDMIAEVSKRQRVSPSDISIAYEIYMRNI